MTRQLHLGAFPNYVGHHIASWRYPETASKEMLEFEFYKQIARTAERGKFDMIFFADSLFTDTGDAFKHYTSVRFDPLVILSAIAAVTERIGLAATVSTSFSEPYNVARKFATLDRISGGRAAWNVVTSSSDKEAQNFNLEVLYDHDERYERAEEFVGVVKALWNSWEDDALIINKAAGVYADLSRVHAIDHKGKHFSVKGPLNVPRSRQGQPVIIQAGMSERARQMAAREAEIIFTIASTLQDSQKFYADIKRRLAGFNRSQDAVKVIPGLLPIIGRTKKEAEAKERELEELVIPALGVSLLSDQLGVDLSPYPWEGPLPELSDVSGFNGEKGRYQLFLDMAKKEALSIKQLALRFAKGHGHLAITGTASQVADEMEKWFVNRACDGFNIKSPYLPGSLTEFVDEVIPELQERGLFRTEYRGSTLREHLGLMGECIR